MKHFFSPTFGEEILGIAQAYGGLDFWTQNLIFGANADATWRALLVVGAMKNNHFAKAARNLLTSPDSRVRAWACYALGQMQNEDALEQIYSLNADHSSRVRIHAWQAVQAIVGPEESYRHFPISIPTHESLILISEDSENIRKSLSDLYRSLGFRVRVASSERETVELALALKPQAIITDNQKEKDNLSGLNMTWDLCRKSDLRETVIFMLTADFVEPIFIWSGGDFYLPKSFASLEDLAQVVVEYLHH